MVLGLPVQLAGTGRANSHCRECRCPEISRQVPSDRDRSCIARRSATARRRLLRPPSSSPRVLDGWRAIERPEVLGSRRRAAFRSTHASLRRIGRLPNRDPCHTDAQTERRCLAVRKQTHQSSAGTQFARRGCLASRATTSVKYEIAWGLMRRLAAQAQIVGALVGWVAGCRRESSGCAGDDYSFETARSPSKYRAPAPSLAAPSAGL